MKSALAFASAAVTQAANLEQAQGYVIDLCPSEPESASMTMPSTTDILDLNQRVGFVDTDAGYGSEKYQKFELLGKLNEYAQK
jgi:hypothetical protein